MIASPVRFLSRSSASQARSRSTSTGCGSSAVAHRCVVAARERKSGEQAERDRFAVRQVEVGGRLEPVGERVAEVEPPPHVAVVRVAQADAGFVGRGSAHVELGVGEQPRLDQLGQSLPLLALGQRLEQRLVDHHAGRPVERADEVLALGDVDRRLAADPASTWPTSVVGTETHGMPRR